MIVRESKNLMISPGKTIRIYNVEEDERLFLHNIYMLSNSPYVKLDFQTAEYEWDVSPYEINMYGLNNWYPGFYVPRYDDTAKLYSLIFLPATPFPGKGPGSFTVRLPEKDPLGNPITTPALAYYVGFIAIKIVDLNVFKESWRQLFTGEVEFKPLR